MISKTCDHALRAALYIAIESKRTCVPINEIADKLNISFHFLTKILQILTQNRLLNSFKGPNGGVALALPAAKIVVMDIVEAIDGPGLFENCFLGLAHCDDDHPCPMHSEWTNIRGQLQSLLKNTSLLQLADKIANEGYRLTDFKTDTLLT